MFCFTCWNLPLHNPIELTPPPSVFIKHKMSDNPNPLYVVSVLKKRQTTLKDGEKDLLIDCLG